MVKKIDCCSCCNDKSCATIKLNHEQLNLLSNNCCRVSYSTGDRIVHSKTFSSHLAYIRSGLVKEHIDISENKNRITRLIRQHHYLGLESVFVDKINNYNYTALEPTEICLIDADIFRSFVRSNGNFSMEILRSLSRTNLYYVHHFIDFSEKQVNGRISALLLYLSQIIYESNHFTLSLSRQELADMIYVSRESVIRAIRTFDAEQIIKIKGKNIQILKPDSLAEIAKHC
ncbi:MAG: Crp/Fnr family transcriptional regulator [Bacteroidales bacterium]|nr:Crp/Fnr family transcriptional regulator [Bacteroidales bacterium]